MSRRNPEASPDLKARIAGGLWLITIITASFGIMSVAGLMVRDDPAATATNILGSESVYRISFLAELVAGLCYLGVTVLLYELLKPVSRSLSTLAAFFGLGGIAFGSTHFLSRLAPLVFLRGDEYLSVFTPSQLQAMALAALELYALAFSISMVLFGLQCFIAGYLIMRSGFVSPIPGVLLAIGGASYIIVSFTRFLSPSAGAALAPLIWPAGLVGEGSITLWFLVRGVSVPRWTELAHGPAGRQME